MNLQEKEEAKMERYRKADYSEPKDKRHLLHPRLTAICIVGQRKAICKQRILLASCVRKETVDIGIS